MLTLILLMLMKNTLKKIMGKNNYLKIQTNTQSLKHNYKTSIHILIMTSHHQQLTQVSWLSIIMTQKILLVIRNIFSSISDDSQVNRRGKKYKNTTQYNTVQLDVGSKSHAFTNVTIFTYIRNVKCNLRIIDDNKTPAKVFGIVMVNIQKKIIISLWL